MSYVATSKDIDEAWEEFYLASERLGNTLKDATYNTNFTQRQVIIMNYLETQLKTDRCKLEIDFKDLKEAKNEQICR